jgi:hypothetical protein
MTYAFTYDVPGDADIYRQVTERIGDRPDGLTAAVVTTIDGGLRHLNVWESREQWVAFRDGRLQDAVFGVLGDLGIPAPTEPPEEHVLDVVGLML